MCRQHDMDRFFVVHISFSETSKTRRSTTFHISKTELHLVSLVTYPSLSLCTQPFMVSSSPTKYSAVQSGQIFISSPSQTHQHLPVTHIHTYCHVSTKPGQAMLSHPTPPQFQCKLSWHPSSSRIHPPRHPFTDSLILCSPSLVSQFIC